MLHKRVTTGTSTLRTHYYNHLDRPHPRYFGHPNLSLWQSRQFLLPHYKHLLNPVLFYGYHDSSYLDSPYGHLVNLVRYYGYLDSPDRLLRTPTL